MPPVESFSHDAIALDDTKNGFVFSLPFPCSCRRSSIYFDNYYVLPVGWIRVRFVFVHRLLLPSAHADMTRVTPGVLSVSLGSHDWQVCARVDSKPRKPSSRAENGQLLCGRYPIRFGLQHQARHTLLHSRLSSPRQSSPPPTPSSTHVILTP